MTSEVFKIGSRVFRKEIQYGGNFGVPYDELADACMADLPAHSSLEITALPESPPNCNFGITALNDGSTLSLYGGADYLTKIKDEASENRLRRIVDRLVSQGVLTDPMFLSRKVSEGLSFGVGFSWSFTARPKTLIRDAAAPLVQFARRLAFPESHVFVCHASEDKPLAARLGTFIVERGADVWLDQWEIRVGDSIVERVNLGLETVTHLAVIISRHSVQKPWVRKELSAALMRQLENQSITIMPLRIDDSPLPAILSDICYADCRTDVEAGFHELLDSLLNIKKRTPSA